MSKAKPIFSIESERAVIGSLLFDESALGKVSAELSASDFYSAKHGLIYNEIIKVSAAGLGLDTVLVATSLEESGLLDEVGGLAYLGELVDMTPSSANVSGYAKHVSMTSSRRKVMAAGLEFLESLKESEDPFSVYDKLGLSVDDIRVGQNKSSGGLFSEMIFDSAGTLDLEEPDYWIEDFLPKDSFSMIFGPSGQFKSFIAMDMACSIATGISYHGNDTEEAPVIYMTGEGQRSIRLRKIAWEKKHNKPAPNMGLLPRAIDMTSSSASSQLSDAVREFEKVKGVRPKLLIIDTLNRSFGDGDENSTQDMTKFVKSCDAFRADSGCDIIVIHHSGKDVLRGARGSSVLKAALDTEFSVARIGEDMRGRNVTLSCTKIKDGGEPPDLTFNMKQVLLGKKNKKGKEIDSLVPEMIDNPASSFGEREEQVFIDIVERLGTGATVGAVLKEFKQNMPAGVDQSNAAELLKAIASNCNAYIAGGKYLLIG